MDKFSGKPGDNDFKVWVDDSQEATTDCGWDNKQRVQWFSWFLMGPARQHGRGQWGRKTSHPGLRQYKFTTASMVNDATTCNTHSLDLPKGC